MATIFVTGATGVLGRGAVARLLDDGHHVRALARNPQRAAPIAAMGAEPVVADIYDLDAMTQAVAGAGTVMHLATRIPPVTQARRATAWAENTKLRVEGTKVIVDAALAAGVERVIAESITFIYRDGGADWLDEQSPTEPASGFEPLFTLESEVARFTSEMGDGAGIALRFGSLYGADARSTDEYVKGATYKVAPVLGAADGYVSSIHADDAASAIVAALGAPAGIYNVVDDVPLTRRAYVDAFARAFGFGHLRILPPVVVRVTGGSIAQNLMRSQRVSNAALKSATGWRPRIPSAVEGWAETAAARKESARG